MVWMPAHLQFENGGESLALIPTRYPGSEDADDGVHRARAQDGVGADRPTTPTAASASASSRPTPAKRPFLEIRALSITQDGDPAPDRAGADHG